MSIQIIDSDALCLIFKQLNTNSIINYRLVDKYGDIIVRQILLKVIPLIITNKIIDDQLKPFEYIETIDLKMCRQITNEGLKYLKNTKTINLRGCHKITDDGLNYLESVTNINLSGCFNVTNEGIKKLKNIKYVDLSWNNKFQNNDHLISNKNDNVSKQNITIPNILINKSNTIDFGYSLKIKRNNAIDKNNTNDKNKLIEDKLINKQIPDEYNVNFEFHSYISPKVFGIPNEHNAKYLLYKRQKIFEKIYDEKFAIKQYADNTLENYTQLLPNIKLYNEENALNRLYKINPYIKTFCIKLNQAKLDVLIAGSTGLYCVWNNTNYEPGDIDIYIKKLEIKNLQLIEDIIYQTFDISSLIVVRAPLTMTFYIQTISGKIYTIQLNMLYIESWAQIFVTYHSDIPCIGYEISTNKFVYLKGRWNNILTRNVHYFSNILNFDTESTLQYATHKYKDRGFKCQPIIISSDIKYHDGNYDKKNRNIKNYMNHLNLIEHLMLKYYQIACSPSDPSDEIKDDRIDLTYLPAILYDKYQGKDQYAFASSIIHLYNETEIILPIVYLSVFMIEKHIENAEKYLDFGIARKYFNESKSIRIGNIKCKNQYIGIKCLCGKYVSFIAMMNRGSICCRNNYRIFQEFHKRKMFII